MSRRSRHRRSATVLAALQLVLGVLAAVDLVVCREASGEVAVESALAGDCCVGHGAPPRESFGRGSDACDCVDTPLVGSAIEVRPGRTPLDLPPVLLALPGPPPFAPTPGRAAERARPARSAPSTTPLRSVVLLV